MAAQHRQIQRLHNVITELIKIQDDGKGSDAIQRMLDMANEEISRREIDYS